MGGALSLADLPPPSNLEPHPGGRRGWGTGPEETPGQDLVLRVAEAEELVEVNTPLLRSCVLCWVTPPGFFLEVRAANSLPLSLPEKGFSPIASGEPGKKNILFEPQDPLIDVVRIFKEKP